MSHDQDTKQKFIELRTQGLSFQRIADQLQVSKQTLINWSRDLKMDIDNLRAIRLEALQEQYYTLREKRIELLGQRLHSVLDELAARDLKNISTQNLLNLLCKFTAALKKDETHLSFHQPANLKNLLTESLKTTTRWNG
ncbi:MAG: hypothetical protein WC975_15230 [Phycisphaerae bacterium]